MKNNLLAGVIGITIAIILIASMVPTMLSSSDNIKSIGTNTTEGAITYSLASDPEVTISHGTSVIDVNGYELTPSRQTIIAACDTWCIFAFDTNNFYVLHDETYDTVLSTSDAVISNGVLSYTKSNNSEITMDVVGTVIYGDNVNPSYVGYTSGTTFNTNANSKVYIFGNPGMTNSNLSPNSISPIAYGFGTIGDLEYACMNIAGVTASSVELTTDPENTAGHLSITNKYDAEVTNTTGTYSTTQATYGTYVPINYDDITSSDQSMRDLIGIIPIMLIIAVLIMAVGLVSKSRI